MAFVAPPDAAPDSYCNLMTPPQRDGRSPQRHSAGQVASGISSQDPKSDVLRHHRSKSSVNESHGVIKGSTLNSSSAPVFSGGSSHNATPSTTPSFSRSAFARSESPTRGGNTRRLRPVPRSPPHPSLSLSPSSSSRNPAAGAPSLWHPESNIVTPGIGESKDITSPVAGPSIRTLSPTEIRLFEEPSSSVRSPIVTSPTSSGSHHSNPDQPDSLNQSSTQEAMKSGSYSHTRQYSDRSATHSRRRSRSRSPSSAWNDSKSRHRSRSRNRSPSSPSASEEEEEEEKVHRRGTHGTVIRSVVVPYAAADPTSETSYMFYDAELHGVGPPPELPKALQALSSHTPHQKLSTRDLPTATRSSSLKASQIHPSISDPYLTAGQAAPQAQSQAKSQSVPGAGAPPPRPPRRDSPSSSRRTMSTAPVSIPLPGSLAAPGSEYYSHAPQAYSASTGVAYPYIPASSTIPIPTGSSFPYGSYGYPQAHPQQVYYPPGTVGDAAHSTPSRIPTHLIPSNVGSFSSLGTSYGSSGGSVTSSHGTGRHIRERAGYEPASSVPSSTPPVGANGTANASTGTSGKRSPPGSGSVFATSTPSHLRNEVTLDRNASLASTNTSTSAYLTGDSATGSAYTSSSHPSSSRLTPTDTGTTASSQQSRSTYTDGSGSYEGSLSDAGTQKGGSTLRAAAPSRSSRETYQSVSSARDRCVLVSCFSDLGYIIWLC
jgi:hypothetical protein